MGVPVVDALGDVADRTYPHRLVDARVAHQRHRGVTALVQLDHRQPRVGGEPLEPAQLARCAAGCRCVLLAQLGSGGGLEDLARFVAGLRAGDPQAASPVA